MSNFNLRHFFQVTLLTSIWVNISEVFRYFVFVIPRAKAYWNHLSHIADMNWVIFGIWGIWDTILTAMVVFMYWLFTQTFGKSTQSILTAGTLSWLFFFVLFWIGAANMGYSDWSLLLITLPLSWVEMIIACFIAHYLYKKF